MENQPAGQPEFTHAVINGVLHKHGVPAICAQHPRYPMPGKIQGNIDIGFHPCVLQCAKADVQSFPADHADPNIAGKTFYFASCGAVESTYEISNEPAPATESAVSKLVKM